MKKYLIILFAVVMLLLAACLPVQQGSDATQAPTQTTMPPPTPTTQPTETTPTETTMPTETSVPTETDSIWDKFVFFGLEESDIEITDFTSFQDALDRSIALWGGTCDSFEIIFYVYPMVDESEFAELDYLSLTWNESPKWACEEVSFEALDAELLQAYAERSDFSQIHICPPMRYIIADD